MSKDATTPIVSKKDAMQATIEYFEGDELAASVWVEKYALRNDRGDLLELTPTDMHKRIAKEFARIEKGKFKKPYTFDEIFEKLDHFKYIVPQGSPMNGIGNDYQLTSLSNCYVLDVPEDSYGDILRVDEQLVQISKRRGGIGINLSKLRPIGSPTHNSSRTSTGIVTFMDRYSHSIREVGQGGRRGAAILILDIHHPEILNFITAKDDLTKVTGANISVQLSDEFLKAVEADGLYEQRWPVDSKTPKISNMVSAREIWNKIIKQAHKSAEPGILFWDTVLRKTPSSGYPTYKPVATNPCAELILSPLDSCRLMLLNLFSYVKNPFTDKAVFDMELFNKDVYFTQRLMDDLIDLEAEKIHKIIDKINNDPEPEYTKTRERDMWIRILKYCVEGRRTGTGTTGLADALAAIGISYGSDESVKFIDNLFKNMKLSCYRSSVDMAKELGPFSDFDPVVEAQNEFIQQLKADDAELYDEMMKHGRRNIALTTLSPAGSVSILTQTSSGTEPVFELVYQRRRKITDKEMETVSVDFVDASGDKFHNYNVYHQKCKTWMNITGATDVKLSPWYNACANDITWEGRVKIQGTIQKHICHSISSTVNLPRDISVETVAKIYENAWKNGCKGITVYRTGSRDGVLIETTEKKKDDFSISPTNIQHTNAPKRPKELPCDIHHIKITKKLDKVRVFDYMVLVGLYHNEPFEVFAIENGKYDKKLNTGKVIRESKGKYNLVFSDGSELKDITSDTTENEDALTRMVSTALRHGAAIQFIVDQLSKVEGADLFAYSKSIARTLKKYVNDGLVSGDTCATCGSKLIYENGCKICKQCGDSKCS